MPAVACCSIRSAVAWHAIVPPSSRTCLRAPFRPVPASILLVRRKPVVASLAPTPTTSHRHPVPMTCSCNRRVGQNASSASYVCVTNMPQYSIALRTTLTVNKETFEEDICVCLPFVPFSHHFVTKKQIKNIIILFPYHFFSAPECENGQESSSMLLSVLVLPWRVLFPQCRWPTNVEIGCGLHLVDTFLEGKLVHNNKYIFARLLSFLQSQSSTILQRRKPV